MAYAVINKSGCGVHKGNVKVRLDFFLEPTDPRYDERYLYLVDVTSGEYLAGYPGKVDEFGDPVDQEDYDKWWDALPRIWQNTPFHSHFVYFGSDVTQDDIKPEMEFHLPNFYKAFQERWDEVKGGMRHGWATEKRIRPTDYSKTDSVADYATRVAECQATVDALTEFSHEPEDKVEGQEFPATAIDVGAAATDRAGNAGTSWTNILLDNPANDTGTIDTFEIWAYATMSGTNKVGTFYGSGTDYTSRDCEAIGEVTAGAKRTFTGLDIDITSGDFAGSFNSGGSIEADYVGFAGIYRIAGDQCGTGQQTYALRGGDTLSLYGTGETAATAYIDIPTRFRLWARAFKDVATRFKLWVQGFTDIPTRFKLEVQNYIDITTRFKLIVQQYSDTATRFLLNARSYVDTATRFILQVSGYVDIPTRFRLLGRSYQDIATRFKLTLQTFVDIATRFRLNVRNYTDIATRFALQITVDVATRFKLIAQAFTDTATRFRLSVQNHTDVLTRFKLTVQDFKDIATLFKLIAQEHIDIATRFRLLLQPFVDIATRFQLVVPHAFSDTNTRFFLYVPTWKELQIQAEIADLEADVDALGARAHFRT